MHVGGSHKTMREGWPQDARALKQQPAQPPPTSAAGYLPLPVYLLLLHTSESLLFSKETTMKRRSRETAEGWQSCFFFPFSSVGKKSGSIYTFFQRHFLVIGSRSLPSFYFLSGKFFWFKYRTLVLPYYTHLLRAANIPYWLTHPVCVCVCVCEDTSQKCQEEVGMWETGQLKIDTDWLRK